MKLGINGWRLQTRTGVARVLLNVIKYWTRDFVADRFQKITLYTPTPLRAELPIPDFLERQIVGPNLSMLVWENLRFAMAADDDVLFCPSFSRPMFARGKTVTLSFIPLARALYRRPFTAGAPATRRESPRRPVNRGKTSSGRMKLRLKTFVSS